MSTVVVGDSNPQRVVVHGDDPTQVVIVETVSTVVVTAPGTQGPPGPAGPGGGSYYFHTQAAPSSSWVINHNLGRRAHVTVYIPDGTEVEADVVHNNDNQVAITFASPETGTALIA